MILVSYIDILDFIGDDRLCLIEGEELFNGNKVSSVEVLCRSIGEYYEISAQCEEDTSHSKDVNVCIKIDQNKKKTLLTECTCVASGLGKCGHVAAILIYLHRNPTSSPDDSNAAKSNATCQVQLSNTEKKTVSNSILKGEHVEKGPEEHYRRKLRHKRSVPATGAASYDGMKILTNKVEPNEAIDDPSWDKENDREDEDAYDFSPSSDDDWKPSPVKKRPRKEISLFPSENPKEGPKTRKRKHQMDKPRTDKNVRELKTPAVQGSKVQFKCQKCDLLLSKEDELCNHLNNIHSVKRELFSCKKCKRIFKSSRTLQTHQLKCDVDCGEGEEVDDVECDTSTTQSESQKDSLAATFEEEEEEEANLLMEPLQCLLCEVAAGTRREMHDHYLLAHRTHKGDTVSVCDRCGEFRLPRDHICPSQVSFRCRMCRVSFKAGRDYWNHLIRLSKAHAARAVAVGAPRWRGWRCGWPRCAECFPAEEELKAHVRLHLPHHAAHMCTVCGLVLRNADAKVAHLAKHDSGVYECDACAHACADKEALRQHWDEHAADRPHLCHECGWRFVSEALLQVHARKVHEGGPFSCAKCPSTFSDRTDVRVHFGAAHGKLRCPQSCCTFRCTSKAALRRHDALAHALAPAAEDEDEDGNSDDVVQEVLVEAGGDDAPTPEAPPAPAATRTPLPCPTLTCEETFAKRADLLVHVRDVHGGVRNACPVCSKPFRSRRALDEHVRAHTGEKPFICAECGMTFKRVQNLEHHIKGAHKKERNFSCPECAKRFISNADMLRHLRNNHQGGKKWHLCTQCGHKAPSLYNLKQHVQSKHTGERPHKCHLCEAGFVARADLNKHVMYRHNKEQPFGCEHCERRYQRRRDLQLHQQRHHPDGSHVCAVCGKDFDSYASMVQHARYHTSEEAFQCAKCGRRFPHRMNLSRHLCTPDIKKNFRCATCGLSFTTSGSLKSHRRRLHAGEEVHAGNTGNAGQPRAKEGALPAGQAAGEQRQQQDLEGEPAQSLPSSPMAETPQPAYAPVIHHGAHELQQHYEQQEQQEQQPAGRAATHRLHPDMSAAPQTRQQHAVAHEPRHHHEEATRYEDKLWRGGGGAGGTQDAWAALPVAAQSTQSDAVLTLTTCPTYRELENAATHSTAPAMQLMASVHAPPPAAAAHTAPPPPAPSLVIQQSNVLRYSAVPPPPAGTLVVKAGPPPLVSLVKADHHQMMFVQPCPTTLAALTAAPGTAPAAPTVKLVSVSQSQPPPLASLSSVPGQLQTTADGAIHLVFVPATAQAQTK